MTPCEKKGYKVGQVFRDTRDGDIGVLTEDDGSDIPIFFHVKSGDCCWPSSLSNMVRVYPPEDKKTETIELMGKTYSKAEIERALSGVLPV